MAEPPPTLLLVEDDPTDIALMERAFAKAEIPASLRVVRDGEDAVHYLVGQGDYADRGRHPFPSLILLDLKLPKRNGFEVLRWLREQPKIRLTPVVVLTASNEVRDREEAYALHANSYVLKPMGAESLLDLVRSLHAYWIVLNRSPHLST